MEHQFSREEFFRFANTVVATGQGVLSQALAQGWMKANRSFVSHVDFALENAIEWGADDEWPGIPNLSEERHPSMPQASTFVSIDGLDGTGEYMAGRRDWSLSAGIICEGQPVAGVVVQPALRRAFAIYRNEGVMQYDYETEKWVPLKLRMRAPRPTIGTDFGPNSPDGYLEEMGKLVKAYNVRPTNLPAVAGGIEIMLGSAICWWSYTAHHWDMAAVVLMMQAMGGVAECLDGSPIPWTTVTKLPPILLAESREVADRIRLLIASPEADYPKSSSS